MATYKTPGVYVEEISTLPASVAQVETAIPAFIGYTAMAQEYATDDLLNVPTKIGSMLDFTQYFGGEPSVDITSVNLDSSNQVTNVDLNDKYYLFEAMRMFYANGGGYCYIVSVGKYGDTIQNGDGTATPGFLKGLNALRKVDEPTLLLAPDASLMSQTDMNSLHTSMLTQCADLQDRFSIFDVRKAESTESYQDTIDNFRDGIGMNNLKYGAAYSPWINANLPRSVRYADFKGKITKNATIVPLSSLITDPNAQALATRLDKLTADQSSIAAAITGLQATSASIQAKYEALVQDIKLAANVTNAKVKLTALATFYAAVNDYMTAAVTTPTLTDTGAGSLVAFLTGALGTSLTGNKDTISRFIADANTAGTGLGTGSITPIPTGYNTPPVGPQVYFLGADTALVKIQNNSLGDYNTIWTMLKGQLDLISSSATSFTNTVETAATDAIPALKTIFRAIASDALTLPPSSSIAGVYASVDAARGVWKAPANVSLNSVVGVTELVDSREQADLNVDVIAGKSINIIRPFTGKGILVWGARTLAGNDNEWRYISVRRFFIMVEESVKKATEGFVFEANDANTWVKLRAMVENFLILQWRAGALAGAKPDQAFYVRVGLGQTMSAQDILEGRMNVEIGMAVVRPAEFIVLKFSHKLQEA